MRPAPRNVIAEAVSGTVLKVSWSAVPGATGYEVWRSLSKSSGYSLVKNTAATSWSNTYRTPGTRYFYQVRSTNLITIPPNLGNVVSGQFSAPVAGVPLAKPVISSATATGSDRVKLVIAPVTGATGYRIYACATPGGTYRLLRTTTVLTTIVTGLTPNTVYYFKAQAYKKIYTSVYVGPLSGYKGAKTLQ